MKTVNLSQEILDSSFYFSNLFEVLMYIGVLCNMIQIRERASNLPTSCALINNRLRVRQVMIWNPELVSMTSKVILYKERTDNHLMWYLAMQATAHTS